MHDRKVVIKGQLIITHPGITHFDELTGSLILDVFADVKFRIERHEPTSAELDKPGYLGGRHQRSA